MTRWLVGLLMLSACGGEATAPDPTPDVGGIWQVTAVNGQPVPALTPSDRTFYAGYLTLVTVPSGSTPFGANEYCAAVAPDREAFFDRIQWTALSETSIRFTYPDFTGAAVLVDTATLAGGTLHWHAKIAEGRLGTSQCDMVRISTNPDDEAPPACGT